MVGFVSKEVGGGCNVRGFPGEAVFHGLAVQEFDEASEAGSVGVGGHEECPCQGAVAVDGFDVVREVVGEYFLTIVLQGVEVGQRTDELVMNGFAIS